jgi:uncharacterized protein YqeY
MSLKEKVSEDLKTAMKEKNPVKLSVLRVLKAEIQRNEQAVSGKVELTDGDIIKLVKKLIEGIKETNNNQDEILVLESYMPKQLTEEFLRETLNRLKETGVSNMGDYMKYFKTNHDGLYDGKILSSMVKEYL